MNVDAVPSVWLCGGRRRREADDGAAPTTNDSVMDMYVEAPSDNESRCVILAVRALPLRAGFMPCAGVACTFCSVVASA